MSSALALLVAGYALTLLHIAGITIPGTHGMVGILLLAAACALVTAKAPQVEPDPREQGHSTRKWVVAIAALTAILFFGIGYAVLSTGHPAEDAFIMFRYAEHLAEGRGIVWNPDGPRAEGATDFLWLLGLAAGNAAGLDVAVAALLLNALGAGLLAALFTRAVLGSSTRVSPAHAVLLTLVPLSVVLPHWASAAHVGFSSMLYAAFVAWIFQISVAEEARLLVLLPALGLVLGLFRPDGVLIGVAFTLLGFWRARERGITRAYSFVTLASGVAGLAYFAWRYAYFGLLLPLPLYVKSRSGVLLDTVGSSPSFLRWIYSFMPGLQNHFQWLASRSGPLPALLLILCLVPALRRGRSKEIWRLAVCLIPLALCFAELAFGTLLQNVDFRFQGPITAVVLLVLLQMTGWAMTPLRPAGRQAMLAAAIVPILLFQWLPGLRLVGAVADGSITQRSYVDMFAPILGRTIPTDTMIVLTEAGRVPYWTDAQVVDATGLNTPRTVLTPPSQELLREFDADIIFFHNALTLDFSLIPQPDKDPVFVLHVRSRELRRILRPRFLKIYEEGLRRYEANATRPVIQTLLIRYLVDSDAYEVVAVDEERNGTYEHVWAFRKGWELTPLLLDRLEKTGRDEPFLSYLDLKKPA